MFQLSLWCEKWVAARHNSVIGNQLLFANNRNRARWVFLCLSHDGACTDSFENFRKISLKGDLSNDITLNPLFSHWSIPLAKNSGSICVCTMWQGMTAYFVWPTWRILVPNLRVEYWGGNQFACGQVSRSINVTDKPQERGRRRGVEMGGRGLDGLERRTQCTVIHVKGKACSIHTATKIPFTYSFSGNCAASVAISHSCVCSRFTYSQDLSTSYLQQNKQIDHGNIYESLTDTWMWKLGLWPRNSFSGNVCFEFSVLVLCSAYSKVQ
jgi:hypothetical protein